MALGRKCRIDTYTDTYTEMDTECRSEVAKRRFPWKNAEMHDVEMLNVVTSASVGG